MFTFWSNKQNKDRLPLNNKAAPVALLAQRNSGPLKRMAPPARAHDAAFLRELNPTSTVSPPCVQCPPPPGVSFQRNHTSQPSCPDLTQENDTASLNDMSDEFVDEEEGNFLFDEQPYTEFTAKDHDLLNYDLAQMPQKFLASKKISIDGTHIKIVVPVDDMHALSRAALGLDRNVPVVVLLDISQGYTLGAPFPQISVYQASIDKKPKISTLAQINPSFTLGVKLVHALNKHLQTTWNARGANFLADICSLSEDRVLNCGNTCLLCDDVLEMPGLNPTVCAKDLCAFQFDHLGLGTNTSLLHNAPLVADLLLSFAVAAGRSPSTRFSMPKLPVGPTSTCDFTARQVSDILAQLPSVTQLDVAEKKRELVLKAVDTLAPSLTRWTFATNRAHIVAMEPTEQIAAMQTPYQFHIRSATRQHEQQFRAHKAKHGSRFVFHGSRFEQWHNIVRENLINASDTEMMSTGARFGPGVYAATNSKLSRSYTDSKAEGWPNSALGPRPRCLAICEVANAPSVQLHARSGVVVIPDASCVTLRYLMVYPETMPIPAVDVEALNLSPYQNDICFVSQEPISTIAQDNILVTADQFIWDIEEVVDYITLTTNGVFINGFTKQGFTPADVAAIIDHPTGLGKALGRLEERNFALRQHISAATRAQLAEVGQHLANDDSFDFAPSQKHLAALIQYIETLSDTEKKALELAPFSCTDSHSNQPFRSTVRHQIDLAASGGDCFHRTGDFLRQAGLSQD